MRLGEALAVCPGLCLLEPDPARVEAEWEHLLRRLEEVGIAVEPEQPGCLYFETRHVERLYRGLEQVLERALLAVGPFWTPRLGAAARRFAALAAASVARDGQALIVPEQQTEEFLAPLPLELLPMPEPERERLHELGVRTIGQLTVIPGGPRASGWARRCAGPGSLRAAARPRRCRGGRPPPRSPSRSPSPRRSQTS